MNVYVATFLFVFLYEFEQIVGLKSSDVRNYLGTRTPYRFRYNKDAANIKYPHCKDNKIWMMVRHGTRLPSTKDILGMNSTLHTLKYNILLAHRNGRGQLNKEQLQQLEEWTSNVDVERQKYLTREGKDEMVQLAERMAARFPNTIKKVYDNQTFLFKYTATERAQQSARYFTIGLFDKKNSQEVIFAPTTKVDPILRFYKHCDKWQKQVKKNPNTYEEQILFGNSIEMNNTLDKVSRRLGLSNMLTIADLNLMYKICGFETSWRRNYLSPWCYGFDPETAKVLEYYHDLKHYWLDGYGHDLTYRQACLSIKHMFDNFSDENGPNATFLFAHSGTLLKILAHLQLYKPESHLRGVTLNKEHQWKASKIDCFASNLAFVLYKCRDGDHVLTLHQERIIKLPMCDTELCPLKNLTDYFHESIHDCDYSDMCSLARGSKDASGT